MEFRNPDEDLPRDFDVRRTEHYQALRKPLDPAMFIDALQSEMRAELGALNDAMPLDWLEIRARPSNQGAVKLSPLDALPEPQNLGRLKKVITGRWGTVPLIDIANATFGARRQSIWGVGSTTVAFDSTHFGAFDANILTEYHSRYGGCGVLIYWHVERKSMVIHSQVINCSASEVAAMIDGAMHHGTAMDVEANYTDTHDQSIIGFGLTSTTR
jgi:hypothetical protein